MYARFKDNIWTADLTEMGSLSSMKRGVTYLLCFYKLWVKLLKDKNAKTVVNGFIKIVKQILT